MPRRTGNWIAYEANESGRTEIYVQPFPDGGKETQVSTDIGYNPVWSADGDGSRTFRMASG